MKNLIVSLFFLFAVTMMADENTFDSNLNPRLFTAMQKGYNAKYLVEYAESTSSTSSQSEAEEVLLTPNQYSSSLEGDAQLYYEEPSIYTVQTSYSFEEEDLDGNPISHSHQWIGDADSGYAQIGTLSGETINFHPPDGAVFDSFEDMYSFSWTTDGGTEYTMQVLTLDGLAGLYERSPNEGWVFENHINSYADIPDDAKGYFYSNQ